MPANRERYSYISSKEKLSAPTSCVDAGLLREMRMRMFLITLSSIFLVAQVCVAAEQDRQDWGAITRNDISAAVEVIRSSHPYSVDGAGGAQFNSTLEEAEQSAIEMADGVVDWAGHYATLLKFAAAFEDRHIKAVPMAPFEWYWPGVLVHRDNERWRVRVSARQDVPVGSSLISCDGIAADKLFDETVAPYFLDARVPAQVSKTAGLILLDFGNPFVRRPSVCVFGIEGARVEKTLIWDRLNEEERRRLLASASPIGQAGMGLRKLERGFLVALQHMDARASSLLNDLENRLDEVRSSEFLIVDLRGNSGGNSFWGRRLLELIHGPVHVRSSLPQFSSDCGAIWRVSPGNLAHLENLGSNGRLDDHTKRQVRQLIAEMNKAMAVGELFARPRKSACSPDPEIRKSGRSAYEGIVYVVTDASCTSSCLLTVREFIGLGAVQVGQETDVGSNLIEIRSEILPSGRIRFTTVQAVHQGIPAKFGPYKPTHTFPGDIRNADEIVDWTIDLANKYLERK